MPKLENKTQRYLPLQPSSRLGSSFIAENFTGQTPINVLRTGSLKRAQCYANCRSVVAQYGGKVVLGYLLIWWPGHFVEALHHAVWRRPDGSIEDVTAPAYPGLEKTKRCWFFPDDQTLGPVDPTVAPKFSLISTRDDVRRWTELVIASVELAGQAKFATSIADSLAFMKKHGEIEALARATMVSILAS